MPAPAAQKVTYQSLHRYTVDANRRVQMPLAWRSAKPVELTMIVWPQHDCGPCLRILPPDQMEKLREKIELMAPAEKTSLKRHIGSSSIKVELDSAKRIAIPQEMADAVGIRNEAVFAGMLDYFEIWSPERYADMHSQEKRVVANALKSLE
jgi:division/cell wall cluster transcriptional repressor MraZ